MKVGDKFTTHDGKLTWVVEHRLMNLIIATTYADTTPIMTVYAMPLDAHVYLRMGRDLGGLYATGGEGDLWDETADAEAQIRWMQDMCERVAHKMAGELAKAQHNLEQKISALSKDAADVKSLIEQLPKL